MSGDNSEDNFVCLKNTEKLASKRSPNWNEDEVRTLCEFVKTHKEKLFGLGEEANKKGVNAAKKKHWELAASIINEQFATKRHWSQVRKKWKDLSYYARNPDKRRRFSTKPFHKNREERGTPGDEDEEEPVMQLARINSLGSSDGSSSEMSSSGFSCSSLSSVYSVNVKSEVDVMEPPNSPNMSTEIETCDNPQNGKEEEINMQRYCCSQHPMDCLAFDSKVTKLLEDLSAKLLQNHSIVQTSRMSAYEKARLELEREKVELQETATKCLFSISKEIRKISGAFCRTKRRRKSDLLSRKKPRWHSDSDSSV